MSVHAEDQSSLLDPFDLPEWLVVDDVVWEALEPVADQTVAKGALRPTDGSSGSLRLDLLAVDSAWPVPACSAGDRRAAHQAWHFGEVVVLRHDDVPALGVPTSRFSADLALEALRRFARAVGSDPKRYAARLRL